VRGQQGEALDVLQAEIRQCQRCVTAGYIAEARPLTDGKGNAVFFVVGQAPSRTDHETGEFYNGPAGKRLRQWFLQAGFSPDDWGTVIYPAAITKCFPGRLPGSSKDRVPSKAEQKLCREWLDREMTLINPAVVVLFGGLAITTFLSKDPLVELIGKTFERQGRIYLPLPHSSGASTWLNEPENRERLAEAIECLRELRKFVQGEGGFGGAKGGGA